MTFGAVRGSRRLRLIVLSVLTASLAGGVGALGASRSAEGAMTGFVRTCGTHFCLGGSVFQATGWNTYDLLSHQGPTCNTVAGTAAGQATVLAAAAATRQSVVRFWLFQDSVWNGSYYDWSNMDQLVTLAHIYGVHLMPVFENGNGVRWKQDPCFRPRPHPEDAWYAGGYNRPYAGMPETFWQYARQVASRYANEPAIFGWTLMNEPVDDDYPCDSAFYQFFATMTGAVRAVDPNHLITSGSPGPWNHGWTGTYANGYPCPAPAMNTFMKIFALPNNNIVEFHDYYYNAGTDASVAMLQHCGALRNAAAQCDTDWYQISLARRLNKPAIVGEMGFPNDPLRAANYARKLANILADGGAGYMAWEFELEPQNYDWYAFGPGDPVLGVLAKYGCGC